MMQGLSKKGVDVKSAAEKASKDGKLLSELLEGVTAKKEEVRRNSLRVLDLLSGNNPEVLYPRWWDFFVKLLSSDNTYHKLSAVRIIANLTKVDAENKFEKIFDRYYGLLDDKSMIPAAWAAGNSGKIARAKPELQTRITNRLLSIDGTHHHPERRDLIKGYAIEAFSEYFEEAKDKKKIMEFVRKQLNARSPKTKKLAKEFLEKRENEFN